MTPNQKLRNEVAYLRARSAQLEYIIEETARAGLGLKGLMGRGITSTDVMTDISSGEFGMRVLSLPKSQPAQEAPKGS